MPDPMTTLNRDEIVELMARALAKEDHIEICSDATYRLSAYGLRAQAALRALEARGCQIVQGEPRGWIYNHPDGEMLSQRRIVSWQDFGETALFALKVQP
jgi:hypothetical protein